MKKEELDKQHLLSIKELFSDYYERGTFEFNDDDFNVFSYNFGIDKNEINQDSINDYLNGLDTKDKQSLFDFYKYVLLNCAYKYFKIKKFLTFVKEKDNINEIYNILFDIKACFDSIDMDLDFYKTFTENIPWDGYHFYSCKEFDVKDYASRLLFSEYMNLSAKDKQVFVELLIKSLEYEINERMNVYYLFIVLYLIRDSKYYEDNIKLIAKELINYLYPIFRNGRLISIQINGNPIDKSVKSEERGKNEETTILLMLFGFDNFDSYCLRLDSFHKGQENIHINLVTSGYVFASKKQKINAACYLTADEYKCVLAEYPHFKKCFIGHNDDIYFVKEKSNIELSEDEMQQFENFIVDKLHYPITSIIDEDYLEDFKYILKMYYPEKLSYSLKEEEKTSCLLKLDKIMCLLDLCLFFSPFDSQSSTKIIEIIIGKIKQYGIDVIDNIEECDNLDGLLYLIKTAEEELNKGETI